MTYTALCPSLARKKQYYIFTVPFPKNIVKKPLISPSVLPIQASDENDARYSDLLSLRGVKIKVCTLCSHL